MLRVCLSQACSYALVEQKDIESSLALYAELDAYVRRIDGEEEARAHVEHERDLKKG